MLPGTSGLTLARHLRDHTQAAVLFLTARDEVADRLAGFEAGAGRLHRQTLRDGRAAGQDQGGIAPVSGKLRSGRLQVADLLVDEDAGEVIRAGETIAVTATELRLLDVPRPKPRAGAVQDADPHPGVGLRGLRPESGGGLCLGVAQEVGGQRFAADPHGARGRLSAERVRAADAGLVTVTAMSQDKPLRTVSLRRRVAVWTLLLLVVVLTTLGLVVNWLLGDALRSDLRQRLDGQGQLRRRPAGAGRYGTDSCRSAGRRRGVQLVHLRRTSVRGSGYPVTAPATGRRSGSATTPSEAGRRADHQL